MNSDTALQAGGTSTSQCSPNQLKHSINDKIGEDECDHERHSGRTEDANAGYNEPKKVKDKVLMLELRE